MRKRDGQTDRRMDGGHCNISLPRAYGAGGDKKPNTVISSHFYQPSHNKLDDLQICVLSFIKTPCKNPESKTKRLQYEALWQHRLHSLALHGLNTLDIGYTEHEHEMP